MAQEGADAGPPAPKVYSQPELPGARGAPENISWSQFPGVPTALVDAIDTVTRRDPSALAAISEIRASSANVQGAKWQQYPSLTADMSVTDTANRVAPTLTVDVPVWAAGRISSNIKRSRSLESAAGARWQETVLSLALQVASTYYDIVLYTQLESLYRESLREHENLVESMQRRVNQEVSPRSDLELARSRAAQIEQELLSVSGQRNNALQTLAELVRDPLYQLGGLPPFDTGYVSGDWRTAANEALDYSPTRQRLEFELDAARKQVDISRGGLFPQVSAQYSYNEVVGSRVGLGVRLQTLNGLSRFSDISGAMAKVQSAQSQISLFDRQLRQDIANDVIAHDTAVLRAGVSLRATDTADKVSAGYMRQFIAGRRSWLDVMNSLRERLSAHSGLVQAQVTAMAATVKLSLRTGRWQPDIQRLER